MPDLHYNVGYIRGNTYHRDHIHQQMYNTDTWRTRSGTIAALGTRNTDNRDVFPSKISLEQIMKWVWKVKTWKLNGSVSFITDGPRMGFNEDTTTFTSALGSITYTCTFTDAPIGIGTTGAFDLTFDNLTSRNERELLISDGDFPLWLDNGDFATLSKFAQRYISRFPGNYQNDKIIATPYLQYEHMSYLGTGGGAAAPEPSTLTAADGHCEIDLVSTLDDVPAAVDFGFGISPTPPLYPPLRANVEVGMELLHFDPTGTPAPAMDAGFEDDQVLFDSSGLFSPYIYLRIACLFAKPIVVWSGSAIQNSTYGPIRPNAASWSSISLFSGVTFGTIIPFTDLDGDWPTDDPGYYGTDTILNAFPAVSAGADLVIDGGAATVPIKVFESKATSPNLQDPPYGYSSTGLTLEPLNYWTYRNRAGDLVYDPDSGAQLENPFG